MKRLFKSNYILKSKKNMDNESSNGQKDSDIDQENKDSETSSVNTNIDVKPNEGSKSIEMDNDTNKPDVESSDDENGDNNDENSTHTSTECRDHNVDNDKYGHKQSNQPIHAIDLVLQEIGEQATFKDNEQNEAKKLTFSTEEIEDVKPDNELQQQSCSNPEFRYKVLDTIFLFWNTTTMGWVYGQMGPALPDLQFLVGASLQEATWVFTGFAIGYLVGCLLAGLVQDRFNPRMMLFLYTLGTAITIGVLPWLPVLAAMVAIRVINGICIGGQDTGLHSMLFAIWAKDGGPFVQMTHVLSALGGILAPLVTQPFVSTVSEDLTQHAVEHEPMKTNVTSSVGEGPTKMNVTYNSTMWNNTSNITIFFNNSANPSVPDEGRSTNIHFAFLITGILVLTAAIPFLVAYLQKRKIIMATRQYSNESVDKNKLPKKIKRLILCILTVNSFVATAYIDLFPSFLTTFVMEQVSWSQKSASAITSVYFATYAAGNFIGVFILAYITATKLIVFSYISSSIMILGILLSIMFNHTELIWVTVGLAGLTMSGILPTLFTWTQEHVTPITARLASILLISGSAGVMVNPLLLGYMMEQLSPMWFIYLSLGETVFCALLFATAFTLSRIYSAQCTTKSHEISALNENVRPESENESAENKTEIYPRGTLYGI